MIRLTIPSIDDDDLRAVSEVLASGYLVQGPKVATFEQTVADYVGTEHAVAVSNCTAALHVALLALGVGPGDRVAVTTFSWPATANVIALCGAEPVFIEIEQGSYNMDPMALEKALEHTTVKAILQVHAFGGLADMPRILEVATRHGVPVVEDAACALGAELGDRQAGAWGVMGCFSFHPRKAITTGEGGVITTNDAALARTVRILRNHGLDPDSPMPDFVAPGYNLRLTEFQAALGVSQMTKLDRIVETRRQRAAYYDDLLRHTAVTAPQAPRGSAHVYQSYVALLPNDVAPHRAEIISTLKTRGIETTIGTYHMPLTTYYRTRGGYEPGQFPVTDNVAARAISLPLHEFLEPSHQSSIVANLVDLVNLI